jgi:hypothetical protein
LFVYWGPGRNGSLTRSAVIHRNIAAQANSLNALVAIPTTTAAATATEATTTTTAIAATIAATAIFGLVYAQGATVNVVPIGGANHGSHIFGVDLDKAETARAARVAIINDPCALHGAVWAEDLFELGVANAPGQVPNEQLNQHLTHSPLRS